MANKKTLAGANLAGMSTTRERVENDFYATPMSAVEAILNEVDLEGSILEPAAGQGHISKVLKAYYPNSEIISTDLVQREDRFGIPIQGEVDFLTYEFSRKKVIIFAKIQLLEGNKRRTMFDNSPLKYVYVFTKRVNPLRNGEELDEKGRPWSSTMCFAWFVWEHGYEGEPMVRWL